MEIDALGDFAASPRTSEAFDATAAGTELGFPEGTAAVAARLQTSSESWLGTGSVTEAGADVSMWPRNVACPIDRSLDILTAAGGDALGFSADARTLLIAGGLGPGGEGARAGTVNLATGSAEEVDGGMLVARAFASVTPFGDGFIVAGGVDPRGSGGDPTRAPPVASAEIFRTDSRAFDRDVVTLSQARARHAAVRLDNGETLLVGGTGENNTPLATLEAISPETNASRIVDLTVLSTPRSNPQVVRLDDGRLLVAGGFDSVGETVSEFEWLTADGARRVDARRFVTASSVAVAGLPGGAALAVGACDPVTASGLACDPASASRHVSYLTRTGQAVSMQPLPAALACDDCRPELAGAVNGAPWLLIRRPGAATLLRFDPWQRAMVQAESVQALDPSAQKLVEFAGHLVWRTSSAPFLRLVRYSTRNALSRDVGRLLIAQPDAESPIVPAAALVDEVEFTGQGLKLSATGQAVVTTTRYRDVTVELEYTGMSPPLILLDETRFGGVDCPWPRGPSPRLQRRGRSVTLSAESGVRECEFADSAPVAISIAGGASGSVVRSLRLRRSADGS